MKSLRRIARRQPFEPFRVILTTGATYDVRHPDLIMVGRRSAIIGVTKKPDRTYYDNTIQVDLLHVVGVEGIATSPTSPNGPAGLSGRNRSGLPDFRNIKPPARSPASAPERYCAATTPGRIR